MPLEGSSKMIPTLTPSHVAVPAADSDEDGWLQNSAVDPCSEELARTIMRQCGQLICASAQYFSVYGQWRTGMNTTP